jgi:hypothetical protein
MTPSRDVPAIVANARSAPARSPDSKTRIAAAIEAVIDAEATESAADDDELPRGGKNDEPSQETGNREEGAHAAQRSKRELPIQ